RDLLRGGLRTGEESAARGHLGVRIAATHLARSRQEISARIAKQSDAYGACRYLLRTPQGNDPRGWLYTAISVPPPRAAATGGSGASGMVHWRHASNAAPVTEEIEN